MSFSFAWQSNDESFHSGLNNSALNQLNNTNSLNNSIDNFIDDPCFHEDVKKDNKNDNWVQYDLGNNQCGDNNNYLSYLSYDEDTSLSLWLTFWLQKNWDFIRISNEIILKENLYKSYDKLDCTKQLEIAIKAFMIMQKQREEAYISRDSNRKELTEVNNQNIKKWNSIIDKVNDDNYNKKLRIEKWENEIFMLKNNKSNSTTTEKLEEKIYKLKHKVQWLENTKKESVKKLEECETEYCQYANEMKIKFDGKEKELILYRQENEELKNIVLKLECDYKKWNQKLEKWTWDYFDLEKEKNKLDNLLKYQTWLTSNNVKVGWDQLIWDDEINVKSTHKDNTDKHVEFNTNNNNQRKQNDNYNSRAVDYKETREKMQRDEIGNQTVIKQIYKIPIQLSNKNLALANNWQSLDNSNCDNNINNDSNSNRSNSPNNNSSKQNSSLSVKDAPSSNIKIMNNNNLLFQDATKDYNSNNSESICDSQFRINNQLYEDVDTNTLKF